MIKIVLTFNINWYEVIITLRFILSASGRYEHILKVLIEYSWYKAFKFTFAIKNIIAVETVEMVIVLI